MFLLALLGCAQSIRVQKFLGTPTFVSAPEDRVVDVSYVVNDRDDTLEPYAPEPFEHRGRTWWRPPVITNRGRVHFDIDEPVDLRLFVRHRGLLRHDFRQVYTLTTALDRALPSAIRFVPPTLEEDWTLEMWDLHNPFNDDVVQDGDLVFAELTTASGEVGRVLFRSRRLGWRIRSGGGVLVAIPLRDDTRTGAIFAASLAAGYRFDTRNPTGQWIGDKIALVASAGIGSAEDEDLSFDVDGLLRSILIGGGLELYDFVSVQAFVNASSLLTLEEPSPVTLTIGFDAVQFGRATRDATSRLFRRNTARGEFVVP